MDLAVFVWCVCRKVNVALLLFLVYVRVLLDVEGAEVRVHIVEEQ